ncbi:MAG: pyridoxamine 5'-phosphate oxidase [Betaproteobacteria bacterium]
MVNIADLRQEYMQAGLAEADALPDPFAQFERWFSDALAADLPLANAMTLATVSEAGAPDARIVLLKGVEDGGFVFYTNYDSAKGRQLAARPLGCLVFLWAPLERQVRIEGSVTKVSAAASEAYFASRPLGARLSARASTQSAVVPDRDALERAAAAQKAQHGDQPPRPANWGGYCLVPERIEFWQGRANRLHDRLRYSSDGKRWAIERLAP